MFERFTDRARRVVALAQDEARNHRNNSIGTEHILLGLIDAGEGVAARVLESMEISLEAVRQEVDQIIGHGTGETAGHIGFTPRAKKVLELSLREALQLGHHHIGTEHILLGLIREGDGVAAQVLTKLGVTLAAAREEVVALGTSPPRRAATAAGLEATAATDGDTLDEILRRLDVIAARLDAIERHLGVESKPDEPGEI